MKQYLLAAYSTDIKVGEFSYDLSKVTENKISDIFKDHVQIVNTHIWIADISSLHKEILIEDFPFI